MLLLAITVLWGASAGEITSFNIATKAPQNRSVKMILRIPANFTFKDAESYRIMVLFGGRNWPGEKTIKAYNFVKMADKHNIFLISPSFKNDKYWEPEKWSGKALMQAVDIIKLKYMLKKNGKILYFGYSAGAQCAALFYHWKPGNSKNLGSLRLRRVVLS